MRGCPKVTAQHQAGTTRQDESFIPLNTFLQGSEISCEGEEKHAAVVQRFDTLSWARSRHALVLVITEGLLMVLTSSSNLQQAGPKCTQQSHSCSTSLLRISKSDISWKSIACSFCLLKSMLPVPLLIPIRIRHLPPWSVPFCPWQITQHLVSPVQQGASLASVSMHSVLREQN